MGCSLTKRRPNLGRSTKEANELCAPCLEENKYIVSVKFCSECKEHLCVKCTESHKRFKAIKYHHMIDLSSAGSRLPSLEHMHCDIHTDVQLDIKFKENINLESRGNISEITRPCNIPFTTYKLQQAQVRLDTVKPLTEFKRDGNVELKFGEKYNIYGIAVTEDNRLLLCNFQPSCPKVYIYKDCKTYETAIIFSNHPYDVAILPRSNSTVVTLPSEYSVQFINTTNNTKERKIEIMEPCYGVTTTKDRVYLSGGGKVHVLDANGLKLTMIITENKTINSLHYNEHNDTILIRQSNTLLCIDLNGKDVYRYEPTGGQGLAVDRNGGVYISRRYSDDIQRLSYDGTIRDEVLKDSDGIKRPTFLSFNRDFTQLFVVSYDKSVLIYNCK